MLKNYISVIVTIVTALFLSPLLVHAGVVCSISHDQNDKTAYVVELDGAVASPGSDIRTTVNLVHAYDAQGSCSEVSESVPKEMSSTCAGWTCDDRINCFYPCTCEGRFCSL